MAKSREIEVFGLSFMDLISCSLGGMLVIMIVFSTLVNAKGVSTPQRAKEAGKSPAELQREMIFNTHFALKVVVSNSSIRVKAVEQDLVTRSGSVRKNGVSTFLFMVNVTRKVVKKITFEVTGGNPLGTVQLIGEKPIKIPKNTTKIEIIKDKTNYKITFRL